MKRPLRAASLIADCWEMDKAILKLRVTEFVESHFKSLDDYQQRVLIDEYFGHVETAYRSAGQQQVAEVFERLLDLSFAEYQRQRDEEFAEEWLDKFC